MCYRVMLSEERRAEPGCHAQYTCFIAHAKSALALACFAGRMKWVLSHLSLFGCPCLFRYDVSSESLLDVVAHEAQRTFRDRLVDGESEAKFDSILTSLFTRQWKHGLSGLDGASAWVKQTSAAGRGCVVLRACVFVAPGAAAPCVAPPRLPQATKPLVVSLFHCSSIRSLSCITMPRTSCRLLLSPQPLVAEPVCRAL